MTNSLTLIKYNLLGLYNKFNKNKNNFSLVLLVAIIFTGIIGFQFVMTSLFTLEDLQGTGYEYIILLSPLLTWISISLLFIVSTSVLSKENDSDILLSLPIKKYSIILSKSLITITMYFLLGLIIIFPTSIIYYLEINGSITIIINTILSILLLAIFFTSIGYYFNSFINFFVVKFRFYKIIRLVLVLLSVFLFLFFYIKSTTSNISDISIINELIQYIAFNDITILLILLITTLFLFSTSILLFSLYYGKQAMFYKTNKKTIDTKVNSPLISLVKKELKMYFNSTMYLFNTIIGYLLMLGGSIYLLFSKNEISNLETIVFLFITSSLAVTCTTNSSISLEGKNLWILKTSPTKVKTILLSKVLMNLVLLIPTITLSFILLLISNRISLPITLLLYALSLVISVFISIGGILVNLLLPKLDFKNEMEVVKQSASAITSILFFLVFLSTPSLLFLLEIFNITLNSLIIVNIIYILILDIIIYFIFNNFGEKLFNKL